jgi:outer membrane protein OmpA-like peptidoglycan-associated protein
MKKAVLVFLVATLILPACQAGSPRLPQQQTSQTLTGLQQPEIQGRKSTELRQTVRNLIIAELPETIRQEHEDRMNRVARLSRQFGAQAPTVQDNLQVDPGTLPGVDHAVPVIRARYSERTFFDTASAKVRPEAKPILDVLAEAMRRDMPDTNLLILGHTDSRGSNDYNSRLSLDRAKSVMIELANRGVRIEQMATIGIGELQPIATNATEKGMAQNRRVEFMISRFIDANLRLVEETEVNVAFLDNHHRLASKSALNGINQKGPPGPQVVTTRPSNSEVVFQEDKGDKTQSVKGPNGQIPETDPSEVREGQKELPVIDGNALLATHDAQKSAAVVRKESIRTVTLRPPVVVRLKEEKETGPAQKI